MARAEPTATKRGRQTSTGLPDLAMLIEEGLFQGKHPQGRRDLFVPMGSIGIPNSFAAHGRKS